MFNEKYDYSRSKEMKLKWLIPLIVIVMLALTGAALSVSAKTIDANPASTKSQADGPNLLTNPGLEGHYNQQCSVTRDNTPWVAVLPPCDPSNYDYAQYTLWATAQVPFGWSAWWRQPYKDTNDPNYYVTPDNCDWSKKSTPSECVPYHNPEFRDTAGGPQDTGPSRRMEGDNSQKYFTFYTVHEAGLYQVVSGVTPGQNLRFSIYMEAWSNNANDPWHSNGQPTMGMQVGIDPYGGNNPWSSNIIWAPVQESFDHFSQFTVEAVAQNSVVSVWTKSHPFFPQQHNDVYVDAGSLNVVGGKAITSTTPVTRTTATRRTVIDSTYRSLPTFCAFLEQFSGLCDFLAGSPAVINTPSAPVTSTQSGPNTYVVQPGDSLRAIAKRFGTHWEDIVTLNPSLQPPDYKIYVGQVLKLKP
ncbi:MAG TPA: LysM domain-containing protein [Anaerolineae bacterium]|nr:LysM domain-containing protein [Anaerolineae bacterium]